MGMGMTITNLCDSCTNIGCEFQSGIVRTKCAFYMPPIVEADNCGKYLGVDCIDRNSIKYYPGTGGYMYASKGEIDKLPSVTPQEPILDKIRAEIEEITRKYPMTWDYASGLNVTLRIIDKYKSESEE